MKIHRDEIFRRAILIRNRLLAGIFGRVVLTNATIVLAHGHIQDPMQRVLNPPMAACCLENGRGFIGQTGDVVATLNRNMAVRFTSVCDHGESGQSGPTVVITQKLEAILARDSPTLPRFQSAMVFVDLACIGVLDLLEIVLMGQTKKQFQVFMQMRLVVLHS